MAASTQQTPNLADPEIAAVRAHLDQVLASPEFANPERYRRLLRFLVEAALTGNADQIKEYVLGLKVFNRSPDYDPRIDSSADTTGVVANYGVAVSADGDKYAISFMRWLSTLYLVEGLR